MPWRFTIRPFPLWHREHARVPHRTVWKRGIRTVGDLVGVVRRWAVDPELASEAITLAPPSERQAERHQSGIQLAITREEAEAFLAEEAARRVG